MSTQKLAEKYRHPELRKDELFWVNVPERSVMGGAVIFVSQLKSIPFKSKRVGGNAYDTAGNILLGHRPVMVQIEEVSKTCVVYEP
jgi:hypothetical protein